MNTQTDIDTDNLGYYTDSIQGNCTAEIPARWIAEIWGCSSAAIQMMEIRALRKLYKRLRDMGDLEELTRELKHSGQVFAEGSLGSPIFDAAVLETICEEYGLPLPTELTGDIEQDIRNLFQQAQEAGKL